MLDKVLKLAAIASVLMTGGGALHYFVIYLPAAEEKQRAISAIEQRKRELETSQTKSKFNICIVTAKNEYNIGWDDYCETKGLKRDCPLPLPVLEQLTRTRENVMRHCEIEARVNLDQP
jgi:hypothetical protein